MATAQFALNYLVAGTANHETIYNADLDDIDKALGGYLVKSVAGSSNVTLTASEFKNRSLELTGAIGANIAVIVPNTQHLFVVYRNTSGAFTLTVRTAAGTGVAITAGTRSLLLCNGTDVFAIGSTGSAASGANSDITSLSGLTTPLSAPQGGTGFATYAVGDLLYASATNALSKLADVAVGRVLISGGVGVAPAWSTSPVMTLFHLLGSSSGDVTVQVAAAAGTWSLTLPTDDGNLGDSIYTDGSGVTAWMTPRRVEVLADAATVTPALSTFGHPYLGTLAALSQATNFANPTGTLLDGQILELRIISTVARALTWGTKYKGSTALPLPTTTTGSSLREYFGFQYLTATDTFDLIASAPGVG